MLEVREDELDRVLWGAEAIGQQIGRSERQTYHLLENGLLPADKVGKLWTSTPRRLRTRFNPEAIA
jgi:hypothetical protein